MSFKTDICYIQRSTKKRLWDILNIYPSTFDEALKKCRSADDLGDFLINAAIDERYPEEKRLRKEKSKAEEEAAFRIRTEMPAELVLNHQT